MEDQMILQEYPITIVPKDAWFESVRWILTHQADKAINKARAGQDKWNFEAKLDGNNKHCSVMVVITLFQYPAGNYRASNKIIAILPHIYKEVRLAMRVLNMDGYLEIDLFRGYMEPLSNKQLIAYNTHTARLQG